MIARALALSLALATSAAPSPGPAAGQGVMRVNTLAELRGLSPARVRARFVGHDDPSVPTGLVALVHGRPIELIGLRGLVANPAHGGLCYGDASLSLVFGPEGMIGALDRAPRGEIGPLRLQEGLDTLLQRSHLQAPSGRPVGVTCLSAQDRATNRAHNRAAQSQGVDIAGTLQGLVLAPFAVFALPARESENRRATAQGAETLRGLHLGQRPPGGLEAMAKRPGVEMRVSPREEYAVLRIDIGGQPKNNLARMHRYAQVGVRNGLVEWIEAEPGASGLQFLPAP